MKHLKRPAAFLLAAALTLPSLLWAQGRDQYRIFVEKYDLDATTLTFCVAGDEAPRGVEPAVTSGSSTTVTSASGTPFDIVAVGDILYFTLTTGTVTRYVTAKASGASITVDAAIDLGTTGTFFYRRTVTCGTAATAGWMSVQDYGFKTIVLQIDQLNVTGGISVKWQCKAGGELAVAVDVYPGATGTCPGGTVSSGFCNYTAVTAQAVVIEEPWTQCRVGLKIGSADDGTDTGSAAEQISIYFAGTKAVRP